jgi:predicted membrane channel-forming protein YqfA (hemolysin III family)
MLAEISSGNATLADVLFLVAAILFGLAALSNSSAFAPLHSLWHLLMAAGACLVAIAWFVL